MATKPLPEPAEGREGASQRMEVERERARRRWAMAGYDPRAHLRGMTCEGDRQLFVDWSHVERDAWKGQPIEHRMASFLARFDMGEIAHALWEQDYQRRKAAQA